MKLSPKKFFKKLMLVFEFLLDTWIRIDAMFTLLGLAGGNTKNMKSGKCITPIRYNVIHMYTLILFIFASSFPRYLVVFQGQSLAINFVTLVVG